MQKKILQLILLNTCLLASCTTVNVSLIETSEAMEVSPSIDGQTSIETPTTIENTSSIESASIETPSFIEAQTSVEATTSIEKPSSIEATSPDIASSQMPVESTVPATPTLDSEQTYKISRIINAYGIKDKDSLYKFFIHKAPDAPKSKAKKIAKIYIEECEQEGINSDVAFVQMCLETNFLRYGNLVQKEWNNFCGLGAINKENPGLKFSTIRKGVRAHIQHLHAYGTTSEVTLKNALVDPRYKYVNPRGKAKDIFGLSGTWASDTEYAKKLDNFLILLENF